MHEKKWEKLSAHLLGAQTVGLIGFGRIGQRVAELVKAFGARVLVFDPYANKELATKFNVLFVSLEDLIKEADIVSIHASNTAEHPVFLGATEINRMKNGAALVNLARGGMVDETALIEALISGKLSGAGLDVFGEEPYSGPLCDFEQVILTPHSATLTLETRSEMERQCVENAIAFLDGKLDPGRKVI
jgi:D-3-phosphoglycerate dehydrogenase